MTKLATPYPEPENPWMHDFPSYTDEVLLQLWRLFSERDTSTWSGVEAGLFEAAKNECFDEMVSRGLAI